MSQRSSFDETKGVLHTPIAFSASRNFLIQKVYNPAATFADWFAIYVGEYAFSYLPVFFYQHQLVIKREFTGKGVLAEVFCISSVQCGNKFRHKFQLLIVTKSSQLCRQTDPMSVGFFLRSVVFSLCQSFCISFVPVWCTPTMASFPSHRSNTLWFP